MNMALKGIKVFLNILTVIVVLITVVVLFTPMNRPSADGGSADNALSIQSFSLNENAVSHSDKSGTQTSGINRLGMSEAARAAALDRAKEMAEVKWTPKYNYADKKCPFTFVKGKTYYGVPYSMDPYQVVSAEDFLSKINSSKVLYGNDCSGFVSAAWGISRQTTLSFYNAIIEGSKIDGRYIFQISWDELKAGDALLLQDGSGKGHIMMFIDTDKSNSDNLNVYEQNVATVVPNEPIPVARKDVRSKSKLISEGYIPIRISE